jgi:Tfp pilus assembly protein PilF
MADAIGVLRMNTVMYPTSANAFYDLAGGYLRSGQRDLAKASYERTIALDSTHAAARQRLDSLRRG